MAINVEVASVCSFVPGSLSCEKSPVSISVYINCAEISVESAFVFPTSELPALKNSVNEIKCVRIAGRDLVKAT